MSRSNLLLQLQILEYTVTCVNYLNTCREVTTQVISDYMYTILMPWWHNVTHSKKHNTPKETQKSNGMYLCLTV